jgi:drug/metabolite transporter (DMT)-like permease
MIGFVTLAPVFCRDLTRRNLSKLTKIQLVGLLFSTVLYSVIGPLLWLTALQSVSVPTAAILQRFESLELIIWSAVFMNERLDSWAIGNALITLVGVLVALLTPPLFGGAIAFNTGSWFVILSTFAYSVSVLISQKFLADVPLGIQSFARLLTGGLMFHAISMLRNPDTKLMFYDKPELWRTMWWYGLLYITVGEGMWLVALKEADPLLVAVGTTSVFVLTILWNIAIQDVFPTDAQYAGSAFLLLAIGSSIMRSVSVARSKTQGTDGTDSLQVKLVGAGGGDQVEMGSGGLSVPAGNELLKSASYGAI